MSAPETIAQLETRNAELLESIDQLEGIVGAETLATLAETQRVNKDFEERVKAAQRDLYRQRDRVVNDLLKISKGRCTVLTQQIHMASREYATLQIRLKSLRNKSSSCINVSSDVDRRGGDKHVKQPVISPSHSASDSRQCEGEFSTAHVAEKSQSCIIVGSQSPNPTRERSRSPTKKG
jgi:hypothetical protein